VAGGGPFAASLSFYARASSSSSTTTASAAAAAAAAAAVAFDPEPTVASASLLKELGDAGDEGTEVEGVGCTLRGEDGKVAVSAAPFVVAAAGPAPSRGEDGEGAVRPVKPAKGLEALVGRVLSALPPSPTTTPPPTAGTLRANEPVTDRAPSTEDGPVKPEKPTNGFGDEPDEEEGAVRHDLEGVEEDEVDAVTSPLKLAKGLGAAPSFVLAGSEVCSWTRAAAAGLATLFPPRLILTIRRFAIVAASAFWKVPAPVPPPSSSSASTSLGRSCLFSPRRFPPPSDIF